VSQDQEGKGRGVHLGENGRIMQMGLDKLNFFWGVKIVMSGRREIMVVPSRGGGRSIGSGISSGGESVISVPPKCIVTGPMFFLFRSPESGINCLSSWFPASETSSVHLCGYNRALGTG
jgi:hypothetical protein